MKDSSNEPRRAQLSPSPTVTIVVLVHNRLEELRNTLEEMLEGCDYDAGLIDIVVVDNASEDGSAEMVSAEFPQVQLVRRHVNCGVSAWNDGFAVATGDLVLVLDDDCYLPGDGLSRAIVAMREHDAELVSFSVTASDDPDHRFDLAVRTGLLTFWGCAALIRRDVLEEIGGFDPAIFIWAHEVEFMLRFYDRGFRHLHLPEVSAIHMKDSSEDRLRYFASSAYRYNARNFGYVIGRHLRARDACETLVALLAANVWHAIRMETAGLSGLRATITGFAHGLRNRNPLANPHLSRTYCRNFYSFANPWWVMRSPKERLQSTRSLRIQGVTKFYEQHSRFYPDSAATLQF